MPNFGCEHCKDGLLPDGMPCDCVMRMFEEDEDAD